MKKILVPTDFSKNAMNAFTYARELACKIDGQITLLHTFQVPQRSDMLVSMDRVLRKQAEKEMAGLLAKSPKDIPLETRIIKGDAVTLIADIANHEQFSLIVMGTKGASGLREVFIGSTTGGVMRHTNVPILAIPENFTPRPIKNIAIALANMKLSGEQVIAPVEMLTEKFGARLHIFHSVGEEEESNKSELMETVGWLEGLPHTLHIEQEKSSLHDSLTSFVESVDADMLCLVRRKHGYIGFFERLFKASNTLTEVFHTEVPLLVLHSE